MATSSVRVSSAIEWRYDTQSSLVLRLVAHDFVAGMGGSMLLVVGLILASLPEILPRLGTEPILLFVLLFLVGGPLPPVVSLADTHRC